MKSSYVCMRIHCNALNPPGGRGVWGRGSGLGFFITAVALGFGFVVLGELRPRDLLENVAGVNDISR